MSDKTVSVENCFVAPWNVVDRVPGFEVFLEIIMEGWDGAIACGTLKGILDIPCRDPSKIWPECSPINISIFELMELSVKGGVPP